MSSDSFMGPSLLAFAQHPYTVAFLGGRDMRWRYGFSWKSVGSPLLQRDD